MPGPILSHGRFDGITFHIVPDDEEGAIVRFNREIWDATADDAVAFRGPDAYVRATLWERLKAEFATLGAVQ